MNKTIKIKSLDPETKENVIKSLFNQGLIKSKKIGKDGKVPFLIVGKMGMCKIVGDIQISNVKDGILIKAEGEKRLTVGGIFITVFLIFTVIGIILLLLSYYLEGNDLSSKGSNVISGLRDEFE